MQTNHDTDCKQANTAGSAKPAASTVTMIIAFTIATIVVVVFLVQAFFAGLGRFVADLRGGTLIFAGRWLEAITLCVMLFPLLWLMCFTWSPELQQGWIKRIRASMAAAGVGFVCFFATCMMLAAGAESDVRPAGTLPALLIAPFVFVVFGLAPAFWCARSLVAADPVVRAWVVNRETYIDVAALDPELRDLIRRYTAGTFRRTKLKLHLIGDGGRLTVSDLQEIVRQATRDAEHRAKLAHAEAAALAQGVGKAATQEIDAFVRSFSAEQRTLLAQDDDPPRAMAGAQSPTYDT